MKLLVYILIFQFTAGALMPKTDFHQLSRWPSLLEHYNLHVAEAEELNLEFTVFDFIYLHYISPDNHVHDEPFDHSELPFKSISAMALICNEALVLDCKISESKHPIEKWTFGDNLGKKYVFAAFIPPNA